MADKKPAGWSAFHKLTKRLIAVPKAQVDAKIAADRKVNKRKAKKR